MRFLPKGHILTVMALSKKNDRSDTYRTRVSANGRVVISAAHRKALGLKPGDDVIITLGEGELRLSTPRHALRRMQTLVRKHVPKNVSLVDELIRDRRAEASRD